MDETERLTSDGYASDEVEMKKEDVERLFLEIEKRAFNLVKTLGANEFCMIPKISKWRIDQIITKLTYFEDNMKCYFDEKCYRKIIYINKETDKGICILHFNESLNESPTLYLQLIEIKPLLSRIKNQSYIFDILYMKIKVAVYFLRVNKEIENRTVQGFLTIEDKYKSLNDQISIIMKTASLINKTNIYEKLSTLEKVLENSYKIIESIILLFKNSELYPFFSSLFDEIDYKWIYYTGIQSNSQYYIVLFQCIKNFNLKYFFFSKNPM